MRYDIGIESGDQVTQLDNVSGATISDLLRNLKFGQILIITQNIKSHEKSIQHGPASQAEKQLL